MKWIDYKFPNWIPEDVQRLIIDANPNFEDWTKVPRGLKIFAIAELANLKKTDNAEPVAGKFVYYTDNKGFIVDKNDNLHAVTIAKTVMLRPQMLRYTVFTKRSSNKLGKILDALIELEGKMLRSIKFIDTTELLIEIPIGTKVEFESISKAKLDDIVKVHIN